MFLPFAGPRPSRYDPLVAALGGNRPVSYVTSTLAPSETIVYRANFHWLYTFSALLWAFTILGLVITFERLIKKWTTEIVVTNYRFIVKTGWIARQTQEVSLDKIEEINLMQTFWGRIWGYGALNIRGTGVGDIKLPEIDDPVRLHKALQEARFSEEHRGRHSSG